MVFGEKRDSMVDTAAMPLEKANPNFPFSIFAMVFSSSSLVGFCKRE